MIARTKNFKINFILINYLETVQCLLNNIGITSMVALILSSFCHCIIKLRKAILEY